MTPNLDILKLSNRGIISLYFGPRMKLSPLVHQPDSINHLAENSNKGFLRTFLN